LCYPVRSEFITPAAIRANAKRSMGTKYSDRKTAQSEREGRREEYRLPEPELSVPKVFA
jgi:ribosome biogenesis protein BRX1